VFLALCFVALAAGFQSYDEFQAIIPGVWKGTAMSVLGTTRNVQMVFLSDGVFSCHVIDESGLVDETSGATCFGEGVDFDSWEKVYQFSYRERSNTVTGQLTIISVDGYLLQSDVELVVTADSSNGQQLLFRVSSPRHHALPGTFFSLNKVDEESDIYSCQNYCNGQGYCDFYSGYCSNYVDYDTGMLYSESSDEHHQGGFLFFCLLFLLTACMCCCACRCMRKRKCKQSRCCKKEGSCEIATQTQPQVPAEPFNPPGQYYFVPIPWNGAPSAPMYMPVPTDAQQEMYPIAPQFVSVPIAPLEM